MSSVARITSPDLWLGAVMTAVIVAGLVVVASRLVSREAFRQL